MIKPFDLQTALAGKPVVTRDGAPVTDITHFPKATSKFRLGAVADGQLCTYTEEGMVYQSGSPSKFDLFMGTEEVTFYVNVYKHGGKYDAVTHTTLAGAERGARGGNAVATAVPVTVKI